MSGQIVEATLVAAPGQRNTEEEKKAIKERRAPEAWAEKPARTLRKDRHARWTVRFSKAKERPDGTKPPVDIAIPTFGYRNPVFAGQKDRMRLFVRTSGVARVTVRIGMANLVDNFRRPALRR